MALQMQISRIKYKMYVLNFLMLCIFLQATKPIADSTRLCIYIKRTLHRTLLYVLMTFDSLNAPESNIRCKILKIFGRITIVARYFDACVLSARNSYNKHTLICCLLFRLTNYSRTLSSRSPPFFRVK